MLNNQMVHVFSWRLSPQCLEISSPDIPKKAVRIVSSYALHARYGEERNPHCRLENHGSNMCSLMIICCPVAAINNPTISNYYDSLLRVLSNCSKNG